MRKAACIFICLCSTLALAQSPRIVYSKFFKGSTPEYVVIAIQRSGEAVYKEAKDDDNPIRFQVPSADTVQIFDLADKLDHFKQPVESGLKVAHMGDKSFRFEDGDKATEVKFNYSLDPNAQALLDWFERITETEQHYIALERTTHFDKLGVNDVLLQLQVTYDRKRLIAPEQFLPLLDRVIKNESFLHMARARAAALAEIFRKAPSTVPAASEEKPQQP